MIDTDEKVDARTVEEDMETRNNMTWLNNRVVELEAEVKRLHSLDDLLRSMQEDGIGALVYDHQLAEVKRLRKDRDLLWDAIRLSGTGAYREEEIAFWHEKLLNMNEAELKEAFKEHYEDEVDA